MRKILPLIVASLFLFSCSINSEERSYMSYNGKTAIVAVRGYTEPTPVVFLLGKLKSISDDEIILEEVPAPQFFAFNLKYADLNQLRAVENIKTTVIIKKSEVVAIAIVPSDNAEKTNK